MLYYSRDGRAISHDVRRNTSQQNIRRRIQLRLVQQTDPISSFPVIQNVLCSHANPQVPTQYRFPPKKNGQTTSCV